MISKVHVSKFLLAALFLVALQSAGQTNYKQISESYMTIAGTSTLHNWTMTSLEPQIQAVFEAAANGSLTTVKSLTLTVPSQSLKSAHTAMDKNAYSSLKTDKYKTIAFSITSATVQKNVVQCTGNLTICGVTKVITLEATCTPNANGSLHCTGSKAIKMSDYQVEPPTFMFGTVKTGDDITVSFNLQLAPNKN